jgi:hypothetical protein
MNAPGIDSAVGSDRGAFSGEPTMAGLPTLSDEGFERAPKPDSVGGGLFMGGRLRSGTGARGWDKSESEESFAWAIVS